MSDPIPGVADSPWAAYGPVLTGQIRIALAVLGAAGFTWAQAVTASQIAMTVSAILVVGPMVWSGVQNYLARAHAKDAAAASALASAQATMERGAPVAVVVTPKVSA